MRPSLLQARASPFEVSSAARTRSQATTKSSNAVHAMGKFISTVATSCETLGVSRRRCRGMLRRSLRRPTMSASSTMAVRLCGNSAVTKRPCKATRTLSIDPRSWQAHNNRGNLFALTGRLDEAVSALGTPSSSPPRDAESHYNLGNALQNLGRHAEAMQCYTKALSLRRNYVEALINRAGGARQLKLCPKALADFAAVRRVNPRSPYLEGYVAHTRAY